MIQTLPTDGDICEDCGGTIETVGMIGYQNILICDECGKMWYYD